MFAWVHTKCQRISKSEYKVYQNNPKLTFECKLCKTCSVCDKTIAKNHKKLECKSCKKYAHIKCNNVTATEYVKMVKFDTTCAKCTAIVSQKSNALQHITSSTCVLCLKIVTDEQRAILCDKCLRWVHTKCQHISNIEYENYVINHELKFECKICKTCVVCHKTIAKNHKKLECSCCKKNVHIKCNRLNATDYDKFIKLKSFTCLSCTADQIPFTDMPDNQFDMIVRNGVVCADDLTFSFQPNDFQKNIFDRINECINSTSFADDSDDGDENFDISPTLMCQYYTLEDFKLSNFNPRKPFLFYTTISIRFNIILMTSVLC